MRIVAIECAVPSRSLSNEWIAEELCRQSADLLTAGERDVMQRRVLNFLGGAGSRVRYQTTDDEKAIDIGLDAARRALSASGTAPESIDLVIYAGVGRGWLEPATAHVFQAELGLVNASCFDVLDGCASWLRALHVARMHLQSRACKRILIVNCECGFREYGEWQIGRLDDLQHYQATFTIGEAATATVVDDDDPTDDYYFTFKSFGQHYDLCMIPLPSAGQFLTRPFEPRHGSTKFFALSSELLSVGIAKVLEVFRADPTLRGGRYDIAFGHEASARASEMIARGLGIPPDKSFITHAQYGNTVAASVPLGMGLALREGRLKRGDRVLVVVAGSGLTVGFASFTF